MLRLSFMLAVLFGSTVWAFGSEGSGRNGNYVAKLNELARKGRDEKLNARPFYEKAARLYVRLPTEMDLGDLRQWPAELSDSQQSLLREWMKSNEEAIVQLRRGTQRPCYWPRFDDDLSTGELGPIVRLAAGLLWSAKRTAHKKGKTAEIERDILTCCRLSSHFRQTPSTTEQLISLVTWQKTIGALFLIVAHAEADQAFLARLQTSIHRELLPNMDREFDFVEGERIWIRTSVQTLFTGTADDSKIKKDEEITAALYYGYTADEMEAFDLRRGKTLEDIDKGYAFCIEFLSLSPWQAHHRGLGFWEGLETVTQENPLSKALMFNVPTMATLRARAVVDRDALLACLALLRYRCDKGTLPCGLHTLLSANYLTELPMDPYSSQSLVYRRTKDNCVLYSLGADFDDDSGRPSKWHQGEEGGDYVLWPVQMRPSMAK